MNEIIITTSQRKQILNSIQNLKAIYVRALQLA
jgi:hypothetical protein